MPAPDRSAFTETVAALETSALSLNAQEEALREQINNQKKNLTGLSRDELEYTKLATEVESNRRLHAMLAEKLSAARIREQGEMKVVKVIDAAQRSPARAPTRSGCASSEWRWPWRS